MDFQRGQRGAQFVRGGIGEAALALQGFLDPRQQDVQRLDHRRHFLRHVVEPDFGQRLRAAPGDAFGQLRQRIQAKTHHQIGHQQQGDGANDQRHHHGGSNIVGQFIADGILLGHLHPDIAGQQSKNLPFLRGNGLLRKSLAPLAKRRFGRGKGAHQQLPVAPDLKGNFGFVLMPEIGLPGARHDFQFVGQLDDDRRIQRGFGHLIGDQGFDNSGRGRQTRPEHLVGLMPRHRIAGDSGIAEHGKQRDQQTTDQPTANGAVGGKFHGVDSAFSAGSS